MKRLSAIALAAAMVAGVASPAFAQVSPGAPAVGPAGGVSSTTAPSNSQGTPAGGTGVIGTTRVGPSTVAPTTMAPTAARPAARPHRARHHHRPRTATPRTSGEVGTQSQAGTNGAAAPSK